MDLKYNINKMHSSILSQFVNDDVKIIEKSDINFGNYIEFSIIKEDKEVKMIVTKKELNSNNSDYKWFYYENPIDENSNLVERLSNIDNIAFDINDIFENNRFSKNYLNELNK